MSDKADEIVANLSDGKYEEAGNALYAAAYGDPDDFNALKEEIKEQTKDWYRDVYEENGKLYIDTGFLWDTQLYDEAKKQGGIANIASTLSEGKLPIVGVAPPIIGALRGSTPEQ